MENRVPVPDSIYVSPPSLLDEQATELKSTLDYYFRIFRIVGKQHTEIQWQTSMMLIATAVERYHHFPIKLGKGGRGEDIKVTQHNFNLRILHMQLLFKLEVRPAVSSQTNGNILKKHLPLCQRTSAAKGTICH